MNRSLEISSGLKYTCGKVYLFEIVCQSLMCILKRIYSSNKSLIRNFIGFKVYLYVRGLFTKV